MSALLLKISPYLAAAALIFGGGWYAGSLGPKAALERIQAADWQAKALGEAAARKAVEVQLAQAQTVSANNAQAMEKLHVENDQIAADRDDTLARVRRLEQLLVLASHPTAPRADMPSASGGSGAPSASGTGEDDQLETLLVDTANECERNANRFDTLIAEVKLQL